MFSSVDSSRPVLAGVGVNALICIFHWITERAFEEQSAQTSRSRDATTIGVSSHALHAGTRTRALVDDSSTLSEIVVYVRVTMVISGYEPYTQIRNTDRGRSCKIEVASKMLFVKQNGKIVKY